MSLGGSAWPAANKGRRASVMDSVGMDERWFCNVGRVLDDRGFECRRVGGLQMKRPALC